MSNPFFYGGRVEPELFIGRKAELRSIFNCLETVNTGQLQSISIVGPHRMGRSSLLYYIASCYANYLSNPQLYRVAYISLHDPECHTPGRLLHKILQELGGSSISEENIDLCEFQQALEEFKESNIRPIVCMDEFEEVIQTGAFDNIFFDTWRHLMSNNMIAFVIASAKPLNDLVAPDKYTSSFFNIFTLIELGEFSSAEVEQLIHRGKTCDHPFNSEEMRQMQALGGRHPYKLQVAGEKIYLAKCSGDVDWKQIKRQVERQFQQAGLMAKQMHWFTIVWQKLLAFLCSLGRAVLAMARSRDEISDDMALWWGTCVLVILIGLALGFIPGGYIIKGIKALLEK